MTTLKDKFRDELVELLRKHHQFTLNRDLVDVLIEVRWLIESGKFDWED
jgi:hypothetical protein